MRMLHIQPSDGFALFVTRFNATTDRPISQTPSTQDEHRACFYAGLDLVLGALGINFNYNLPGYTPNVQILSILARDDLPYTSEAYVRASRIINEPGAGQSTRHFTLPWPDVKFLYPPATPYRAPANEPQPMAVGAQDMEVTLVPAEELEITETVMPNYPDVINACIIWYTLSHYRGPGGALIEGSDTCQLTIDGEEVEAGVELIVPVGSPIRVANSSAVNTGIIHITIKWFTRAQPSDDLYDTMRVDIGASYSYHDQQWYDLRSYLLRQMDIPPNVPPSEPIRVANRILALALVSRLQNAYVAHSPMNLQAPQNLNINGQIGVPNAVLDALRRA